MASFFDPVYVEPGKNEIFCRVSIGTLFESHGKNYIKIAPRGRYYRIPGYGLASMVNCISTDGVPGHMPGGLCIQVDGYNGSVGHEAVRQLKKEE